MDSDASTTSSIELSTSRLRSVPPVRKKAVPTSVGGASQDTAPAPTSAGKLRMPRRILFVSSSGASSGTFRGTSVSSAAARSLGLRSGARCRLGGAQATAVHAQDARSSALLELRAIALPHKRLFLHYDDVCAVQKQCSPKGPAGVRSQSQSMYQLSWRSDVL